MNNGIISQIAIIWESCKFEFKLIFKDPGVWVTLIGEVLLVAFFYSYIYNNETFDSLPIVVVDQDGSVLSRQVSQMIDATPQLEVANKVVSYDKAKELFYNEEAKGIILIPKDFSKDIQKGIVPTISVYSDAAYMLYYKETLEAAMLAIGTFSGQIEVNKMMSNGMPMNQAIAQRRPFDVTAIPLYNLDVGYDTFLMPTVFIIALQTLQLTAMGILGGTLRERRVYGSTFSFAKGKFSSFFLTIGRSLPYLFIALLLMAIMVIVVSHIYIFPQRANLIDVFVYLVPVILSITFLGMILVNLYKTREDAPMAITIFSIPTLMLTGVSWPIEGMPVAIQIIADFVPSSLGARGFVALTQFGASLSDITATFMKMWGLCLFYFFLAVWTNWRLRQKY